MCWSTPPRKSGDIRAGFPATRDTLGAVRRAECEAAACAASLADIFEGLD
ncbi:MAG TPA: hypothetical protein VM677_21555 [Actinokineospora sp.]|nr:hypothetical protein [Actinokineospora sp.]